MQPKKDPLVIILVVIVSIFLVALLPFLLIFLTGNNNKEVENSKQASKSISVTQTLPVSRIQEADQSKAQADVRQAGSIVEACVTKELGLNKSSEDIYSTGSTGCANVSYLTGIGNYARTFPTSVVLTTTVAKDAVCVHSLGGVTTYWYSTSVGTIQSTAPSGCKEQNS